MDLKIIDKFEEENAICLLCKTTLREYVEALPEDFKDYYIQRGIVSNKFLDNLWDTISKRKHIPPIVLVTEEESHSVAVGGNFALSEKFKILDGLQRSNRLKEAWSAIDFILTTVPDDSSVTPIRLARKFSDDLKRLEISSSLFQNIVASKRDGVDLIDLFESNNIWLEVWFDLSDSQQIQKMLVLNAGHKSVNIKHQIELLFIGYLEILQSALGPAKIVREKDKSSLAYSKGREAGEYHFAHLISAFVSLHAGKPITTNADFSATKSFEEFEESDNLLGIDERLLTAFAEVLSVLDNKLKEGTGVKWLGREVVLVGLFGALGAYAKKQEISTRRALSIFEENSDLFVKALNLEQFEKTRNSLDLSKVNLGSVNKNAVFDATLEFMKNPIAEQIAWAPYFGVKQ